MMLGNDNPNKVGSASNLAFITAPIKTAVSSIPVDDLKQSVSALKGFNLDQIKSLSVRVGFPISNDEDLASAFTKSISDISSSIAGISGSLTDMLGGGFDKIQGIYDDATGQFNEAKSLLGDIISPVTGLVKDVLEIKSEIESGLGSIMSSVESVMSIPGNELNSVLGDFNELASLCSNVDRDFLDIAKLKRQFENLLNNILGNGWDKLLQLASQCGELFDSESMNKVQGYMPNYSKSGNVGSYYQSVNIVGAGRVANPKNDIKSLINNMPDTPKNRGMILELLSAFDMTPDDLVTNETPGTSYRTYSASDLEGYSSKNNSFANELFGSDTLSISNALRGNSYM